MTVPAMAPMEVPPEDAGAEELVDGAPVVDVDVVAGLPAVDDAGDTDAEVDEGDWAFKQEASGEFPTTLTLEDPPCRPRASTIIKIIEVPA